MQLKEEHLRTTASKSSRHSRQFKHDPYVLLEIGGPDITCTSSLPVRVQHIRHNTQVGRMITPHSKPQGNMLLPEGRQQAKQFTNSSV